MSHITYFPTKNRKNWNKRMIQSIRAISPRPTHLVKIEKKNKETGKTETKFVRKSLTNREITTLVESNYNLGSDRSQKPAVVVPTESEATV